MFLKTQSLEVDREENDIRLEGIPDVAALVRVSHERPSGGLTAS